MFRAGYEGIVSVALDHAADLSDVREGPTDLVAIVDDDDSVREALRALLHSHGLSAATFSSGLDFLRSPAADKTACLIADINMPALTGLELHEQLRTSGRQIPTLLMTTYPDEAQRTRALNGGVIGYLLKPFEEDELMAYVFASLQGR